LVDSGVVVVTGAGSGGIALGTTGERIGAERATGMGTAGDGAGVTSFGGGGTVPGAGGRSTRRNEPVGRLTRTGATVPSGNVGRPGASCTPDFAEDSVSGLATPVEASGGCGTIGAGGRMVGIGGGAWGVGADLLKFGNCWVMGSAGPFVWCEMGSRPAGTSTLPLWTNTLACVLATMTRGGWTPNCWDEEGDGGTGGAFGCSVVGGASDAAGVGTDVGTLFCGKSGVVFALGGAPVTGGADGLGVIVPEGGLETLGMGLVTAVDQAGVAAGGTDVSSTC
jgi:hypothetical protein